MAAATAMLPVFSPPCSCPRNPSLVSQLRRFLSSSPSSPSYSALKIHGRIFKSYNKQALKASSSSSSPKMPFANDLILICDGRAMGKGISLLLPIANALRLPNELVEDSKLVPMDSDDPSYGSPEYLIHVMRLVLLSCEPLVNKRGQKYTLSVHDGISARGYNSSYKTWMGTFCC
ncbi:hypothetical protein Dimus_034166 [Dionaea muscipula]